MELSKIFRIILLCLSLGISIPAFGNSKNIGLGAVVGQPTGLTAMYTLSMHRAIDLTVSYDFSRNFDSFLFMGDYLFRKPDTLQIDTIDFGWYWGVGFYYAYFSFGNQILNLDAYEIGPRIPVGLFYSFPNFPVEVFVELGVGLAVLPGVRFTPTAGIGGRYFF